MTYRAPIGDLQFLIGDVLDGRGLFALDAFRHADFEIVASVLGEGARLAAEVIAPLNQPGDRTGARIENGTVSTAPGFREAYARYVGDGWPGLDMPREYGGQGLPRMLQAAFAEMVNGACLSFGMLPLMCRASARLLAEHAPAALAAEYVPRLAAGEWGATICISEPQAGSDVGRIQSLATPADDGSYRLSGSKIFITYGDHDLTEQICHMVLARTPGAPSSTRGISLFLVPKRLIACGRWSRAAERHARAAPRAQDGAQGVADLRDAVRGLHGISHRRAASRVARNVHDGQYDAARSRAAGRRGRRARPCSRAL